MITFLEVRNSNPVLFIYPAGSGGERISSIVAQCAPSLIPLATAPVGNNRYSTWCVLDYATNFRDVTNPDTWLSTIYQPTHADKSGGRHVLKDHPTPVALEAYSRFLPDATVIYIGPDAEVDYFATLTFKKLAKMITTPIDVNLIRTTIATGLPPERENLLMDMVNRFDHLWMHEIHEINALLAINPAMIDYVHQPDLDKVIARHAASITGDRTRIEPLFRKAFDKYHYISVDSLVNTQTSRSFWDNMHDIITDLDASEATVLGKEWIDSNNRLMETTNE